MRPPRLAAVGALGLLIAACTSGASLGGQNGNSSGPITLNVWYYNESGPDVRFMHAVDQTFEKLHPNITLNLTVYPEGNYTTKVDTALAVNSVPDIGDMYQRQWIKAGKFLPLNAAIRQAHINLSTFNRGILSYCSMNGKVYCLGSYAGAVVLFYNKSMFTAAGLPFPSSTTPMTIQQYTSDAARLTNHSKGIWGTAHGAPVTWLPFTTVVNQTGRSDEGVLNSSATEQTYQQLADLSRNGWAPSLSTMDPWNQGIDFFSQGKLAMVIGTLGGVNEIEKARINYGVAPTPVPAGSPPYIATFTNWFGVFAGSSHPKQAEQFVTFLASPQGQRLRMKTVGDIPISSDLAQQLNWARSGEAAGRAEGMQVVRLARPSVFIPDQWDVVAPLFDGFNTMVNGTPARTVLAQAAPQVQANLTTAWSNWDRIRAG
jgi:multiple sugar transport system substrate-binding protein